MKFQEQLLKLREKGVAGLNVYLAIIVTLFIIGFLVMIFALIGGELADATNDNLAGGIINNTTQAIASAIDWFDIIIVISAMVVLILLTVIIIRAIKGSGLVGEGA